MTSTDTANLFHAHHLSTDARADRVRESAENVATQYIGLSADDRDAASPDLTAWASTLSGRGFGIAESAAIAVALDTADLHAATTFRDVIQSAKLAAGTAPTRVVDPIARPASVSAAIAELLIGRDVDVESAHNIGAMLASSDDVSVADVLARSVAVPSDDPVRIAAVRRIGDAVTASLRTGAGGARVRTTPEQVAAMLADHDGASLTITRSGRITTGKLATMDDGSAGVRVSGRRPVDLSTAARAAGDNADAQVSGPALWTFTDGDVAGQSVRQVALTY